VLGDTRQSRKGLIVMTDITPAVPVAIAGAAFNPRHWPARNPPCATVSFGFTTGHRRLADADPVANRCSRPIPVVLGSDMSFPKRTLVPTEYR
jgi:hypothetical protein